tara:strand:+ start:249 stop:512 length:264 start_codon:yes stop_codon:yes gene_type:complete
MSERSAIKEAIQCVSVVEIKRVKESLPPEVDQSEEIERQVGEVWFEGCWDHIKTLANTWEVWGWKEDTPDGEMEWRLDVIFEGGCDA